MSQFDAVRAFRVHVAAPSPAARSSARNRLESALNTGSEGRPAPWLIRRAALVGAAAVAVAVVGIGVSTIGNDPGVLERAQAAVTPNGRILHVVVRIVGGSGTVEAESWIRPDGTGRTLTTAGEPPSDCLGGRTQMRCYDPARNEIHVYRYHPEGIAFGERAAALPVYRVDEPTSLGLTLTSGYARLLGRKVIAGRNTYAILLAIPSIAADGTATPRFTGSNPVLYVDPDTYEPFAQHFPAARSTTHYDTYEYLPDDAAVRQSLELGAPAGTPVVVHPVGESPEPS